MLPFQLPHCHLFPSLFSTCFLDPTIQVFFFCKILQINMPNSLPFYTLCVHGKLLQIFYTYVVPLTYSTHLVHVIMQCLGSIRHKYRICDKGVRIATMCCSQHGVMLATTTFYLLAISTHHIHPPTRFSS